MEKQEAMVNGAVFRAFQEGETFRWDGVELKTYPASGTISNRITKQVLFHHDDTLGSEFRYFEAEPGGYSALEKHQHVHAVLILRGRGTAMVGQDVFPVKAYDIIYTPPHTWHQFHAASDSHLGFLCLVNGVRDRPQRPTDADILSFQSDPVLKNVVQF